MIRLEALRDLKAKVEAGEITFNAFMNIAEDALFCVGQPASFAWSAYNGSLDAAKALHEAVLPGWGWLINGYRGYASVWIPEDDSPFPDGFQGIHPSPARAWLLAILSALIAQEEQQ
jgi:hypothetical protein